MGSMLPLLLAAWLAAEAPAGAIPVPPGPTRGTSIIAAGQPFYLPSFVEPESQPSR